MGRMQGMCSLVAALRLPLRAAQAHGAPWHSLFAACSLCALPCLLAGQLLRELQLLYDFRRVAGSASSGTGSGAAAPPQQPQPRQQPVGGMRGEAAAGEQAAKRRRWQRERDEAMGSVMGAVSGEPWCDLLTLQVLPAGAVWQVAAVDGCMVTADLGQQAAARQQSQLAQQLQRAWVCCNPLTGVGWRRVP